MKLTELSAGSIKAVFSDLDDTLTDQQKMHPQTYQALWDLKDAGYWLVIVSGRPAGWADALMRLWPIDHMIFENGAGLMSRDGAKVLVTHYASVEKMNSEVKKLQAIFDRLKKRIPSLKPASDQFCRIHDYTIDFAEEPPVLDSTAVDWCLAELAKEPGITAKLSSIHINYWYGTYTKVTACERLMLEEGSRRGVATDQVVFVGDSPNDEPMFGYFPNAVGVANIAPFLGRMKNCPRYLTEEKGGKGFEQVASLLLDSKRNRR